MVNKILYYITSFVTSIKRFSIFFNTQSAANVKSYLILIDLFIFHKYLYYLFYILGCLCWGLQKLKIMLLCIIPTFLITHNSSNQYINIYLYIYNDQSYKDTYHLNHICFLQESMKFYRWHNFLFHQSIYSRFRKNPLK